LNAAGYSEFSNVVTVSTLDALSAPQNLANNPAVTNSGIIGITWSAPASNGGKPVIDYCIIINGHGTIEGITSTSYTKANIPPGEGLLIKVKARNADGFGPESDWVSIIAAGVPPAPRNLVYAPDWSSSSNIAFEFMAPTTNGGNSINAFVIS